MLSKSLFFRPMRRTLFPLLILSALPLSVRAGTSKPMSNSGKAVVEDQGLKAARPFDRNLNGVIDGDEIEALRQFFSAHPDSPLKQYDLNKDGKLDDVEISGHPLPAGKSPRAEEEGRLVKTLAGTRSLSFPRRFYTPELP